MTAFFSTYIALGDSMSIDLYPALDAGEIDVAVGGGGGGAGRPGGAPGAGGRRGGAPGPRGAG
ncbi:MAG: hypothetical protein LH467_16700, partial [Gemmatimonadaceae bacterium]|nr:hypothetical protein [Gemmatimonadaceae bacterium]